MTTNMPYDALSQRAVAAPSDPDYSDAAHVFDAYPSARCCNDCRPAVRVAGLKQGLRKKY